MPSTKTPLRYPGGKSQLTNFVYHTIQINSMEDIVYCEPFAGGAGVAMSLLLDGRVKSIILNDLDIAIYSVWYAIIYDTDRLLEAIQKVDVSIDTWKQQRKIYKELKDSNDYSFDLAFATFFLNRTNRSGIISGGPIGGMKQAGKYKLNCRFNKDTLDKRIRDIAKHRANIQLYNMDITDFIKEVACKQPIVKLFIFFDPPYDGVGHKLYRLAMEADKYQEMIDLSCKQLQNCRWIATYGKSALIERLYGYYKCYPREYKLQYMAAWKRQELELLFHSPATKVESFGKLHFMEVYKCLNLREKKLYQDMFFTK